MTQCGTFNKKLNVSTISYFIIYILGLVWSVILSVSRTGFDVLTALAFSISPKASSVDVMRLSCVDDGRWVDMAKWVRIFWPDSNPSFFDPKQKRVDLWPDPCFLWVNPTRTRTIFLKLFFWVKRKIVKLRQYWFNCLLRALRKQLIHIHNCMQINWKINGWMFCNE